MKLLTHASKFKSLLQLTLGLFVVGQAQAANILITQMDYSGYTDMSNALTSQGHTVDIRDVRSGGALAAALAAESYDQVYLFDLTSALYLDGTDTAALASFWTAHSGLVVDARSYGYHFQGTNASEVALLKNVATNFGLTGGGVWVGTDHQPDWTKNGNAFLSAIGVNPVTGSYGNPVNYADPSSVLLTGVTPTALWGGGQTVGRAPIGVQPNGIEMFIHFGHTGTNGEILPYISASFPLTGPVDRVPDGGATVAMLGLALVGMIGFRRSRK